MRLMELIKDIKPRALKGNLEAEVSGISYDSRKAKPGDMFVCIPGTRDDGHKYVKQARERGVVVFLTSREVEAEAAQAVVVVEEPRLEMGKLASRLAGEPSRKMQLIGITGTNGKTTVSYLLEAISAVEEIACGVIGTINYRWQGKSIISSNTTPESVEVLGYLAQMVKAGVKRAAMEVSSHALDQKRVAGICFRAGIFTNLTPEHLDYHENMEAYFQAKARLFTEVLPGKWLAEKIDFQPLSVINLDDAFGEKLFALAPEKKVGYSLARKSADYYGRIVHYGWDGIRVRMTGPAGELELQSPLLGKINAWNILAASACLSELGTAGEKIVQGVSALQQVPGRMERVANDRGLLLLVDYAHTPDALENVLRIVRELETKRLVLVFGCGGDRDRKKRPAMGRIAAANAQLVVVTSDNPRTEQPGKIIEEIEAGIKAAGFPKAKRPGPDAQGYLIEPDRRAAIQMALESAREGDCVLIAGKGHEDYQILGDKRIHFDDREEVKRILGTK